MSAPDFDTILAETQASIRAYIAGMGIARDEVDDLAQEVYLVLYRGLDRLPADVSPLRWLKGVANNICRNHIRRCSRKGRLHREALADILVRTRTDTDRLAARRSLKEMLDDCVSKLPEERQQMIKLRYVQDFSAEAIANVQDSTAQAVRVALFRIRNLLKDCLSRTLAREV